MHNVRVSNDVDWLVDSSSGELRGYVGRTGIGRIAGPLQTNGAILNASQRGNSTLLRGNPLLRNPVSLDSIPVTGTVSSNGFLVGGGGGEAPTCQIVRRGGRNALEITFAPNNGITASIYWKIASKVYSGLQHIVYEVEDASEWLGGNLTARLCTDVNINVGAAAVLNWGRNNASNGLHSNVYKVADWGAVGAGSLASTMTYAVIRAVRKASPSGYTRMWIYEWAEGEKQSVPQIVIGADDGHMTWYNEGLPILEREGFSSYLAYIADGQDGVLRMRDAVEWKDAASRGHYGVVHGCKTGKNSLADYFASYAPYSSPKEAIKADIIYNRDAMLNAGLDVSGMGRYIYMYPQGIHQPSGGGGDDTIISALRDCGMIMARRAVVEHDILCNGGGAGYAMYLPIIGHSYSSGDDSANITAIITAINTAIAAGRDVILMFHEVRAVPTLSEQITPANLTLLVQACSALVRSGAATAGTMHSLARRLLSYDSPIHMLD